MNKQARQIVFVYGTLRQHGSNAFRMEGALFAGYASAPGRLFRVDWYPGAIFDPNSETKVVGELYQVTERHLQALDEFEGNEYRRVNILAITDNGRVQASAWEYQQSVDRLNLMTTGDWLQEYDP